MEVPTFPKLSKEQMEQMLALPSKNAKLRVVIDTDANNEIDDQYALAWALLSQDRLEIEGVYAAPYSFAHHQPPLLKAYEELKSGNLSEHDDVTIVGSYHQWAQNFITALWELLNSLLDHRNYGKYHTNTLEVQTKRQKLAEAI